MHVRPIDPKTATIPVTFIMEDPAALTGKDGASQQIVMAAPGQNLLEVALGAGINIEHACGGVCACSTCHVHVTAGMSNLSEPTEAEEDRVEEAPGLQRDSRLSCQCEIRRAGAITVKVPSWNRNAVKEVPH
ncbi:MAG: 2Fe-2S iron-sulfur cluster binding domain-containing protein [Phycisphaeraceae bacterium]|nr:2Fe-2S iron-sulfur cluster binding domain-containing protein [Phycisphaeraceae bacterium]